MFKPKPLRSLEKKIQEAAEQFSQFEVDEVLRAVEFSANVEEAYTMFEEFEQHKHCEIIKFLYANENK